MKSLTNLSVSMCDIKIGRFYQKSRRFTVAALIEN